MQARQICTYFMEVRRLSFDKRVDMVDRYETKVNTASAEPTPGQPYLA